MTRRSLAAAGSIGLLYFVSAALSLAMTRFNGGPALWWVSSALLIADLVPRAKSEWGVRIAICFAMSVIATGLVGSGWHLAVPIAVGNIGEAWVAAVLMQRLMAQKVVTGSMPSMLLAAFIVAVISPIVAASLIGLSLVSHGLHFADTFRAVMLSHGFGNLTFTPLALQISRRGFRRLIVEMGGHRGQHALPLLALVAGTAVFVFSQQTLPLLFVPLLPMVLVSYRLGYSASALAVVILAVIGGAFTLSGHSPVHSIGAAAGYELQFLQFYLVTTIVTIMPVAAGMHGRAKLDREIRLSEARYRMLAEHSSDALVHIGEDHRIRYISPAITRINGRLPTDLIGKAGALLVAPEDRDHVLANHLQVIAAAGDIVTFEYRTIATDGEPRWLEERARLVVGKNDVIEGVVSMLRDISVRKANEERLSQEAYTDPLTGLANRRGFELAIQQALAKRAIGSTDCIALFDVDHFKRVNDQHGHDVGDAVLHMLGRVMQSSVRDCDTVARMGGEEFAVHLPACSISEALGICERIRTDTAKQTMMAGQAVVRVTISGGVALFDHDYLPQALKQADQALYVAKRGGRNQLALAA